MADVVTQFRARMQNAAKMADMAVQLTDSPGEAAVLLSDAIAVLCARYAYGNETQARKFVAMIPSIADTAALMAKLDGGRHG